MHATPDTWEVRAGMPWLPAEMELVRPDVVVLLGATAGKAVFGLSFRVTQSRGVLMLCADDRGAARAGLFADLRVAAAALG